MKLGCGLASGNPIRLFRRPHPILFQSEAVVVMQVTLNTTEVAARNEWFASEGFRAQYHTQEALGAFCGPDGTVFRLWAPTAQRVCLRLYRSGHQGEAYQQLALTLGARGVWSCDLYENLDGVYYDYLVTVDGITRVTADPYARAAGLNGVRSMVLDLRRTDPLGWEEDRPPQVPTQAVIYEVHVKDFSWDPASGIRPEWRGKYLAFCQQDSSLDGRGCVSTGIAYLKELGVTHVQLMPVYDFGSIDEGGAREQFNWGYDPVNYNLPEGSYATDAVHGEVRIRELKQAIQSLHRNGFRVIMDVVYNHTYQLDGWLWRTVPWYYHRQWPDGAPSNGSGCGNDVATERSMCAQYIVDSVLYWAEEYHMDGFRFDLMGLLDTALMNRIQEALDERFGKGEKLIYGEPWSADRTALPAGVALANKAGLCRLNPQIGAFCDATRDAVKGNLIEQGSTGFVNGGGLGARHLLCCLKGWALENECFPVQAASQTISYLSCHDDWTLWDRLVETLDRKLRYDVHLPLVLRANRLAAAINFCCQGHLFLLSGEEFGRTKRGIRNTYHAAPEINQLDWHRRAQYGDLVHYYSGLIALRKQLPGLCDRSTQAGTRFFDLASPQKDCVTVQVDNSGPDSCWPRLLLAFSARKQRVTLSLPEGEWQVLADGKNSFRWQREKMVAGQVSLAPVSVLILGKRD